MVGVSFVLLGAALIGTACAQFLLTPEGVTAISSKFHKDVTVGITTLSDIPFGVESVPTARGT